jgi:hypothetical protein
MDPVGFGLEQYDQPGRFRTPRRMSLVAPIDGNGELMGIGHVQRPAELSDLMIASGQLNQCVVTQLYRFAAGRFELDEIDASFREMLTDKIGRRFSVRSAGARARVIRAFGYRRDE